MGDVLGNSNGGGVTAAVELKNVNVHLGEAASRVHVLKGVSLTIGKSQAVGLVGPSGSGKSTLLATIAGLEAPGTGNVAINGTPLTGMNEDDLARFRRGVIGIVFQSFHLIPNMTALENVAVPLELLGERDAFGRAEAELKSVGLGEREAHYPAQLSGGEQQRVALARALVADPELLIADEPTGNLDGPTGQQIMELIFSAHRDRGMTLVLVTHDMGLAETCERVVRLRDGRIESDGLTANRKTEAAE